MCFAFAPWPGACACVVGNRPLRVRSAASRQRECTREIGARIIEWARALNADDDNDKTEVGSGSHAADFGEFSAAASAASHAPALAVPSPAAAASLQPPSTPLAHGALSAASYSSRMTASAILSPSTVVAAAARDALGATPVAQPRFSIDGDDDE